jgi:hypothetical protein
MRDNRLGGLALIIGMVANIITMALHPTGHDLLNSASGFQLQAAIARGVHFLALISFPVLFLGALALSRYLDTPNRLSITALVFYGLALIAGMMAVVFSGFLGPGLAKHLVDPADPNKTAFEILFAYNFAINQVFARILASASSLSIVLWSLTIWKTRALSREIGLYGILSGTMIIALAAPGFLRLDVHGFGLVVLLQAVWFITVGIQLRSREDSATGVLARTTGA